jgi:uncharacterized phage protein (TIGR01671 family)
MRKIKFRGAPVFGKGFVYGFINQYKEGFKLKYEIITMENGVTRYEIKPESIGEFTGLKDKNSKKIYEGDIIIGCEVFGSTKMIVKYDEEHAYFYPFGTGDYSESFLMEEVEVIGNIFENPELLKSGDERGATPS